jgi:hypothetical protein
MAPSSLLGLVAVWKICLDVLPPVEQIEIFRKVQPGEVPLESEESQMQKLKIRGQRLEMDGGSRRLRWVLLPTCPSHGPKCHFQVPGFHVRW